VNAGEQPHRSVRDPMPSGWGCVFRVLVVYFLVNISTASMWMWVSITFHVSTKDC